VLPCTLWIGLAATVASLETKHTYAERITPATFRRRIGRIVPYLVINTGMLPHQFSAFTEGLFGPLHTEFERTPKTATVTTGPTGEATASDRTTSAARAPADRPTTKRAYNVKVHWPYVMAEVFFVTYQLAWAAVFFAEGLLWCALGAIYVASCIAYLALFYGDHAGKVCFVLNRRRRPRRATLALQEG
jgi:hypothetical protein